MNTAFMILLATVAKIKDTFTLQILARAFYASLCAPLRVILFGDLRLRDWMIAPRRTILSCCNKISNALFER